MKIKVLLSAIVFAAVVLMATSPDSLLQQYYGKTISEFSGLDSSGVTPNRTWFNNKVFKPIKYLTDKIQWDDTLTSTRYVVRNTSLLTTLFNGESTPQAGQILSAPLRTDDINDTTLYPESNTQFIFPPGYRIDFKDESRAVTNSNLFRVMNDSNVVFYGGEFYGYSDDHATGLTTVSSTAAAAVVTGITVAADSLVNWFVYQASTGYTYKLSGNSATSGGQTTISLGTPASWDTNPTNGEALSLSWAREFDHVIQIFDGTNIKIKDMYMHDICGDGVDIVGGRNIEISGCRIVVPNRFFRTDGTQQLVGRQAITIAPYSPSTSVTDVWGEYFTPYTDRKSVV